MTSASSSSTIMRTEDFKDDERQVKMMAKLAAKTNEVAIVHQLLNNAKKERTSITITTPSPTTVKVYTKADMAYSLTIRDGEVILAPYNEDDLYQYWMKYRYSTVKDEEGFPSFALINRISGQAMKHNLQARKPVQLIAYNPDAVNESILWTERVQDDGYSYIRVVNNIDMILDACNGDKNLHEGGVNDGTTVLVWDSFTGDNQRWKIVPSG